MIAPVTFLRETSIDWTADIVPPAASLPPSPPEQNETTKVYQLMPAWMKRNIRQQRGSKLNGHAESIEEVEYPFSFPTWSTAPPATTAAAPSPSLSRDETPVEAVVVATTRTHQVNANLSPTGHSSLPSPATILVNHPPRASPSSAAYPTPKTPRSPPPPKSVSSPKSPNAATRLLRKKRGPKVLPQLNHDSSNQLHLAHQAIEQKLLSSKPNPQPHWQEGSKFPDSQELNMFLQSVLPSHQPALPSGRMLPRPLSPNEFYHLLTSYRSDADLILQNKLANACAEVLHKFLASSPTPAQTSDLCSPSSFSRVERVAKPSEDSVIRQLAVLDRFYHFLEELLQIRLRIRDTQLAMSNEQHTLQLRQEQQNQLIQRVLQALCSVSVHWAQASSNSSDARSMQQAAHALRKCAQYVESYLRESNSYEVFSLLSQILHLQHSQRISQPQGLAQWKSTMKWAIGFAKEIGLQQPPFISGSDGFSTSPFLDPSPLARIEEVIYTCVSMLELTSSPLDIHLSCIELQFMLADAQQLQQRTDSAKKTLLDCLRHVKHLWQNRGVISYSLSATPAAAPADDPSSGTSSTVSLPLLHAMQETYFRLASMQLQMPKQLLYAVENFQSAIKVRRKFLSKQTPPTGLLELASLKQQSTRTMDQDATLQTYESLLNDSVSRLRTMTTQAQC